MFQVLQQETSPHLYLSVGSGESSWTIRESIEVTGAHIESASAGTTCPASPSNSVSKRMGLNSWEYSNSAVWHSGNITVSCEAPDRCL